MPNNFTNLFETIIRMGEEALREEAMMARLVMQDFSEEEKGKNEVINLQIPRAKTVENVNAGGAQNPDDRAHDIHPITMDQWKQTSFTLNDKEKKEVSDGIFPSDASESLKALINGIDLYIMNQMALKGPYATGTAVPTAVTDITAARKILNQNLAPRKDGRRHYVMNTDVETNMINLALFHQANTGAQGDDMQREGEFGRKFGMNMLMDENLDAISSITMGTKTGSIVTNGIVAIGSTSAAIDGGTSGTLVPGDSFTVAGDPNTYVVTNTVANVASGTMNFFPSNKVQWPDGAAVTPTYTNGQVVTRQTLAFHERFFGFVNRPLEPAEDGLGVISGNVVDPISGLVVRLELARNNKQNIWTWDCLYGGDVIRPEFGVSNVLVV